MLDLKNWCPTPTRSSHVQSRETDAVHHFDSEGTSTGIKGFFHEQHTFARHGRDAVMIYSPLYFTVLWRCYMHFPPPLRTSHAPWKSTYHLAAQIALTKGKKMLRYLKYPSQPTPRSANVVTAIALPNAAR